MSQFGKLTMNGIPEAELELPEVLCMGSNQECAAKQEQSKRIDGAGPRTGEQLAYHRGRQSACERGKRVARDDLGAVPAETLRDRLEKHGKALAKPAAEYGERKTQREHVKRHARRFQRLRLGALARGILVHDDQGAPFRCTRVFRKSVPSDVIRGWIRFCG